MGNYIGRQDKSFLFLILSLNGNFQSTNLGHQPPLIVTNEFWDFFFPFTPFFFSLSLWIHRFVYIQYVSTNRSHYSLLAAQVIPFWVSGSPLEWLLYHFVMTSQVWRLPFLLAQQDVSFSGENYQFFLSKVFIFHNESEFNYVIRLKINLFQRLKTYSCAAHKRHFN